MEAGKAKAIVERMHGVWQYEVQPGIGYVLTVRYKQLDLYDMADNPSAFNWQMRILVIDSDQKFIDRVFNKYAPLGYIVDETTDSEAGLGIFRKEKVHLSIVDEHMPGSSINGVETIRRIKGMDPEACCIMTTRSEEDRASQAQARRLGVIAYYVKPFNIQRINFSITETIGFFKLRDEVKQQSTV